MKKQIILNYGCDEVAEVQVYLYLSTSEWCELAASEVWQDLVVYLKKADEEAEIRKRRQGTES